MNFPDLITSFAVSFGLLLVAMTVHEFAHGWVAYRLGDSTAKLNGRLTLNPLAHIDIFWTVLFPLMLFISSNGQFVFGAAKPVPIDYRALKNPKRDLIWIGLAGPLANFMLAFILIQVLKFTPLPEVFLRLGLNLVMINVILAVFNLIPIPPLDGSKVLMGLLPAQLSEQYVKFERYGFIIIFALIWLAVFDHILWPLVGLMIRLMGVSV